MTESHTALIKRLKQQSKEMRKIIVITAGRAPGAAHVPSALSATELVTALYLHSLKYDSKNPKWEDRDRFILSAGHKSLVQYAALAMKGVLHMDTLDTYCRYESCLVGHPVFEICPGIEASTGSLGHGLGIGCGMALVGKYDKKDYRVFVLLGDGECHEGTIWEAAAFGFKYKLDNLVAIVDYNKNTVTYPIEDIMPVEPFADKWRAFGWACKEIDGHNMGKVVAAFDKIPFEKGKPTAILAHTIKGKGASFTVNQAIWHSNKWSKEDVEKALDEIEAMD